MTHDIIDAWIQHPTPDFLKHPMFGSLRRWMRMEEVPPEIPLDFTMGALDTGHVSRAIITAWWGPEGPLLPNEQVAQWVGTYPDRLVGVAAVDLRRPMDAVRELRRCVRLFGFHGLRVLPWLWQLPPDDRRYYPLYAECIELDVPFCLQVGHAGPLLPSEPGRPIPYLDHVAAEFPELRIVAGHIGFPWTSEMISLAMKYENVYIDTSAWRPSRYPRELVEYMHGPGRKKVLFGSNHPMIAPAACLAEVGALGLDAETSRMFLHDNAVRAFRLT